MSALEKVEQRGATVQAILVRVGADLSAGGGNWNGPADPTTGEYVYVPIPETQNVREGMGMPYATLQPALQRLGCRLPMHLQNRLMHLDPDFEHSSYGDQGQRGKQLLANLRPNDRVVFYAGLRGISKAHGPLIYALIGLLTVDDIVLASDIAEAQWYTNAHSRRSLSEQAQDIVIRGKLEGSGRLARCLPIGHYRDRAYRVRPDILGAWGGLTVKDGYLQRSARLPRFNDAGLFMDWFSAQNAQLVRNNRS